MLSKFFLLLTLFSLSLEAKTIYPYSNHQQNLYPLSEKYNSPRDYYYIPTDNDKKNISYIILTLANTPLHRLAFLKSSLEKAGDQIDHIHPLVFVKTIFLDEELKVGIRNIAKRGWVWRDFIDGISDSFSAEADFDNLSHEYLVDFAQTFDISLSKIEPLIQKRRFETFIHTLIKLIPRKGQDDRYDM